MSNEWADIAGKYVINRMGIIKSVPRKPRVGRPATGKEICQSVGLGGYLHVALNITGKQRSYSIHRLLAQAFIPNPENKPQVNHKNSNRLDNSLENLEWVTVSENNSHAHRCGKQSEKYGVHHHQSKITYQIACEIRQKYKPRIYTMPQISLEYGISRGAIQAILNNKTWRDEYNKQCA